MEIRENNSTYIITPLSQKLEEHETQRIIKEIEKTSVSVGIDLSMVRDCTVDFIENIKKICLTKKVGIFNIPSDIFVLFNIMKLDKYADIYVSELDFEEQSRQIINRNFKVV